MAVDRVSKLVFTRLYRRSTTLTAAAFLMGMPYRVYKVSTDNGTEFSDSGKPRRHPTERLFDLVCRQHGIEYGLTYPYHLWANEQAAREGRLEEAMVGACHYERYTDSFEGASPTTRRATTSLEAGTTALVSRSLRCRHEGPRCVGKS